MLNQSLRINSVSLMKPSSAVASGWKMGEECDIIGDASSRLGLA